MLTGGLEKLSSATFFVYGKLREYFFPSKKVSSDLKFQSYKHLKLDKKNFLEAILREQSVTMLKGKYIVGGKINFGFSSALRDELEIESPDSLLY